GRLVSPNEAGGTNYRSPSFDPTTGLFIVSAQDSYGIYFFKPAHGDYGWAGADYNVYGRGALRAIDYRTGAIRWSHDLGDGASAALKLGLASYSMREFTLDQALDMARQMGVRYMTFKDVHVPRTDPPEATRALRKKIEAAGITIMGGGTITIPNNPAQIRKEF